MTGLVLELQRDCLNGVKVSVLLQKSLVIAKKLNITEIGEWLDKELNGYYSENDDIPTYRVITGKVEMWNPYHGWQPIFFNDNRMEEHYSKRKNWQSVAELESLITRDDATLEMPFPHDVAHHLMKSVGHQLPPTLIVAQTQIVKILDTVRNKILDWSLELEQQGILGEGMSFSNEEKQKAQQVHITNHIDSMHNSQLQQGSSDLTQSFNLTATQNDLKPVIEELKSFVSNPNLKPEQVEEVNEAIATLEIQKKSAKPKLAIIRESVESAKGIMDAFGVTPESIVSFLSSMPF